MGRLDDIVANVKAAYEELVAYVESVPAAGDVQATDGPVAPVAAAEVAADAVQPAAGTETPALTVVPPAESGTQHGGGGETQTAEPVAAAAPAEGLNTAQQDIAPPPTPPETAVEDEAAEEAAEGSEQSSSTPSPAPAGEPPTVSTPTEPPDTTGL